MGDYELDEQIGVGSSGTVWRAHLQERRVRDDAAPPVALKRLRGADLVAELERLRREAAVLSRLQHPHIVRVVDVVEDRGGLAIAMQLASGGSLAALLAERGRLSAGEVVAVAAPIADALATAHRHGIVHGDVKPANILFTAEGQPLLADFGVATALRARRNGDRVVGTAEYLAPELLEGTAPHPRIDIYALGAVCYEALTGRPPYGGPTPSAVLQAADAGIHEPLTAVPGIPEPLAHVIEQAIARHPEVRISSADILARALQRSIPLGQIRLPGLAAPPMAPDDPTTRPTRDFGPRPPGAEAKPARRRYWIPAAAATALLAVGLGYLVWRPDGSDDPDAPSGEGGGCPEVAQPELPRGAQLVEGDPEGDGCDTYGVYQLRTVGGGERLMILTIEVAGEEERIAVGRLGDQVLLGDWNCDGADTPALYRWDQGWVDYFDWWPADADRRHKPILREAVPPGGTASLNPRAADGCDRVLVTP